VQEKVPIPDVRILVDVAEAVLNDEERRITP
jgi:hypothetical protein